MVTWYEALVAASSGGGLTLLAQGASTWLKARGERHSADRTVDAQLEEHRDRLTFELLDAARTEVAAARHEAASLRPMVARLAHFEEALDHIHALLHADTVEEKNAAERRARAFLHRMRRMVPARAAAPDEGQRPRSDAPSADRHPEEDAS
jgi:hypothetical protein